MAKLYFYYSAMNAGKTTMLLQSSYNYHERGMKTLILTPEINDRDGEGVISSRIGIDAKAVIFTNADDLYQLATRIHKQQGGLNAIMVDEAQFLKKEQVGELAKVVDLLDIPVLAYGLRTDFRGELFEGSQYLLAWADNLKEIKTICHCGSKATMVVRLDESGEVVDAGRQIQIGGNDRYISLCRKHYREKMVNRTSAFQSQT